MPKEYAPYGDKLLQREAGSADDWEEVPNDDIELAKKAIDEELKFRADNKFRGPQSKIEIRRVSQGEAPFPEA